MKTRLTLIRPGRSPVDLSLTCDATTTIGEVAQYLDAADPTRPDRAVSQELTIQLAEASKSLDADQLVVDSELRSGQTIRLSRIERGLPSDRKQVAAVLQVVAGPDAGSDYPLSPGINLVGRGRNCQARLSDPMVSRNHVRINVTDAVEVLDLGSANGMLVNNEQSDRRTLRTDDQVQIGDTTFSVRLVSLAVTAGRIEGTDVGFVRSPRLARVFPGRVIEAPEPPDLQRPPRFPLIVLLAPILMAGIMYAVTRNVLSLLFIALSPLMMIGNYLEQRLALRGAKKAALKQYAEDIEGLIDELAEAVDDEVAGRLAEQPPATECVDAVNRLSPLLWTRRIDSPGFAEFRVGLGSRPTRHEIVVPSKKKGPRDLHAALTRAIAPFRQVHGVPIVASPGAEGGLGVFGPRCQALGVARSIVIQAVSLHSPTELVIAAVLSDRALADWDFLKWFPHNAPPNSPLEAEHLAGSAGSASALVAEIEDLIRRRAERSPKEGDGRARTLPVVFLVVESDAPVDFARLVHVAERGWCHGVYVLWVAPELAQLPASCRVYVETTGGEAGAVGTLSDGELVTPVTLETVDADVAMATARRMAPIRDLATLSEDASDLPRNVGLLSLVGPELATGPQAVIERWRENRSITQGPYAPDKLPRKPGNLRGVIGQSGSGQLSLDLRVDGPHALVGGTTGAGKSELLQSWILAMALVNSPKRLTFLLVDYKGGSAFAECNRLPHTVGLVTDLNTNGVRRALTSLSAELRYREQLLEKYQAKDLVALEKAHPAVAPPSLVIVVDEFAALVSEVPEFVDGVVNVAQRGRSLGLHLILATQRPAGVIKGNLRANTNLRIALRVADVEDSKDVIESPMAAHFDQELPGRAVAKTGPGRYVSFQTGYVGGHSGGLAGQRDLLVEELSLRTRSRWELPVGDDDLVEQDPGPTDISRLVENMQAAFQLAQLSPPRKPWLPELASHYRLGAFAPQGSDDCLIFGKQDNAADQSQPNVAFYPDREGNMAIYGAGGTGKSTLLRTLACAAGTVSGDGPCQVYGLDFGARALAILEGLPHVGSIVPGGDDERVQRLLKWLRDEIDLRSRTYSRANASTLPEYRRLSGRSSEPRILLLIDGVATFRAAYEGTLNQWVWDLLAGIAAEGRPVGIHVVVTADRMNAIPTGLASAMQSRLVFRMTDPSDYSFLGVPNDVLTNESPPGRAVLGGHELQVAMIGESSDNQAQAGAIGALAAAIEKSGRQPAAPISSLAERVPQSSLPAEHQGLPVVGQRSDDLAPWTFEPRGGFLITGPPGSGRTTAVRAVVSAVGRAEPSAVKLLLTPRQSELQADSWLSVAAGAAEAAALAQSVVVQCGAGNLPQRVLVVVESVAEFVGTEAEQPLADLIKVLGAQDQLVVVEGEISTVSTGYSNLLNAVRSARAGLALQPESGDGNAVFKTDFPPRMKRGSFPAGRGLLVWRSKTSLGQVMVPEH